MLAVVIGVALPQFDATVDEDLPETLRAVLFAGNAESARAVLSAIAGSLITVTSLTFSLTVVTLQLASGQFSPRLLRLFASDRIVHATLAIFLGTFTYALTVLRTVRGETDMTEAAVPLFAVTLASLLTLVSVITLALYIGYIARQIRVETMLRDVHHETVRTIERTGEPSGNPVREVPSGIRPGAVATTAAASSGFITSVDHAGLIALAAEHDIVVEEEHSVGASVIAGVPLVSWWPRSGAVTMDAAALDHLDDAVNSTYALGYERTASQDAAFGLRQLVDIASRALSPGVNDPTTAEHALSHVSALLSAIVIAPDAAEGLADDTGELRVITRPRRFDALLELAVEQVRRYGSGDPRVVERLFQLLREVGYNARTTRQRDAVRAQCDRLAASIADQDFDSVERRRFEELAALVVAGTEGRWH